MKIVYVYPQFAIPAGTERVLIDKMNYLAGKDYDVLMLTNEQGKRPIVFPISHNIRHVDINVQYSELYKVGDKNNFNQTVSFFARLAEMDTFSVKICRYTDERFISSKASLSKTALPERGPFSERSSTPFRNCFSLQETLLTTSPVV